MIENIYPDGEQQARGVFSTAKKIDIGNVYLIYTSGMQVGKNDNNETQKYY